MDGQRYGAINSYFLSKQDLGAVFKRKSRIMALRLCSSLRLAAGRKVAGDPCQFISESRGRKKRLASERNRGMLRNWVHRRNAGKSKHIPTGARALRRQGE